MIDGPIFSGLSSDFITDYLVTLLSISFRLLLSDIYCSSLVTPLSDFIPTIIKLLQGVKGITTMGYLAYYDYIQDAMVDIVHTIKELMKKILYVLKGERSVKDPSRVERDKQGLDTGKRANREAVSAFERVDDRRQYLKTTPAQRKRADRKYSSLPLPVASIRRSVLPFQHLGSMTMNDWHRYVQPRGPGLYHLAATDLPDEVVRVFQGLFEAIDILVQPEVDITAMERYYPKFIEALCECERVLPAPEGQAIINHSLIEVWRQVLRWGPVWSHWTYIFERFLSRLTKKIVDRSGQHTHTRAHNFFAIHCPIIVRLLSDYYAL